MSPRPCIRNPNYTSIRGFGVFSSRRRHTRLTCDWSSDVCSSDLASCGCARNEVEEWRHDCWGRCCSQGGERCRASRLILYWLRKEDETFRIQDARSRWLRHENDVHYSEN